MKRGSESDAALHCVFNISLVTIDNYADWVFITHVTVVVSYYILKKIVQHFTFTRK